MFNNDEFMDDYSRGMDMLRLANRAFAGFIAGLGYPIANENIPTAQVQVNVGESRIEFHMNPKFIHKLTDSQLAAVLAHEAFHVALNHLGEVADRETFPEYAVLADAHECIINDGLPSNIGFETMEGTFKGLERYNQDFSLFSTQEGYDFILSQREEQEEDPQESDEKQESNSGSGSGEGSGSGDSEKSDEEDSEGGESGEDKTDGSDEKEDEQEGSGKGEDKEKDEEDETGSNDGEGDPDGAEGDENTDESDSGSGDAEDEDGEGSGDGAAEGSCHGIVIVGETDDMDPDKLQQIVADAVSNAMGNIDTSKLPLDLQQALEEMSDELGTPMPGYSEAPPKDGFQVIDRFSSMNMNWVKLLAEINPKLRDSGRPKYKDAWHAPRRRMLHSYPQVILPTSQRMDSPKGKGDSIPTFIIALDMSYSIPERLLKDLAALATSIPEELIRAFPITWSDGFKVFDPERPREIVNRSGTQLQAVMNYARQVEKESKVKPYVLVITDGEYNVPAGWNKEELMEKWYWMGIQPSDRASIKRTTGAWTKDERIFNLADFTS